MERLCPRRYGLVGEVPFIEGIVRSFWACDGYRRALSESKSEGAFEAAKPEFEVGGIGGLRPDRDGIRVHLFHSGLVECSGWIRPGSKPKGGAWASC